MLPWKDIPHPGREQLFHLKSVLSTKVKNLLGNSEYCPFVQKHLQQIENIAQEFLGLFEDYKVSLEKNKPMTDRVYIEKINKIYLFKKQIDKEELKILFQDLLSQLALNQIPSEEFTKEKLATIENKYVKFFNDELEIKVKKKEALKRNLPEAELIGFGASAIKKQTVMDHNKV